MATEKIGISVEAQVDEASFKKAEKDVKEFARDTGKELDKQKLIKLELDLAGLKLGKKEASKELSDLQKRYQAGIIPREAVVEAQRSFDKISSATTEANRQLQNYRNTGDETLSRLQAKFNGVTDEIKKSRDELIKIGKSTSALDKFDIKINQISEEFKQGKIDIKSYENQVKELSDELKNSGLSIESLIGKVSEFGNLLRGGVVAGAIAGVIGFVGDLDTAFKKLENQTGITGDRLESLQDSFVALNNLGFGTIDENVKLITTLNKELGLTGQELTDVSIGVGAVASTFNKDFNETVRATTALVKNFGLSGTQANDIITKSLQTTGDTYDDILDSINEYSAIASDAKIPVEEFVNILLNGTRAGIRNTDELADVQREYAIRLRDGSKTSKEAFESLGLDYENFQEKVKSGETTIGQSMREIAKLIQGIEDPIIRNQIGTDLLGTKFEDNGNIILDVLANVENLLGDVEGANQKLVDNSQTGLDQLKSGFSSFTTEVKKVIIPFVDDIAIAFGNLFNFLGLLVNKGVDVVKILGKSFATGLFAIGESIGGVIAFATLNFKTLGKNIGIAFGNIPAFAQQGLNNFLSSITSTVNKATSILNKIPGVEIGTIQAPKIDLFNFREFENIDFKFDFNNTIKSSQEVIKSFDSLIGRTSAIEQATKTNTKNNKTALKTTVVDNEKALGDKKKQEQEYQKWLESMEKLREANIKKRNDKLKRDLGTLGEAYETIGDIYQDTIDENIKKIDEFNDAIQTSVDEFTRLQKELLDLEKSKGEKLGERSIDVAERQKEVAKEILELQQKGISLGLAEGIGLSSLSIIPKDSEIGGASVEDLIKILELEEERKKLIEEAKLIQANTTNEQLNEAKRQAELSPAEKIIEEFNTQKAIIDNEINLERMRIGELEKAKQEEYAILETFTQEKEALEERYKNYKFSIEEQITDQLEQEGIKREGILENLRLKAIETAQALREAGLYGNESSGTTNNTKTINQNFNINNQVDLDGAINRINNNI